MKFRSAACLGLIGVCVVLAGCKSENKAQAGAAKADGAAGATSVERSATVVETARVQAVDYTTRQVTLRHRDGRTASFVAGPQVRRLNEVKVGDDVKAECRLRLLAELRQPTADEAAAPITIVEAGGRATGESDPAAGVARGIKVVTTVVSADPVTMMVTLRGPMGDQVTVRGEHVDNVKKLHPGDTIVITYVETDVISLEKNYTP